jgi:hypothetical protein
VTQRSQHAASVPSMPRPANTGDAPWR